MTATAVANQPAPLVRPLWRRGRFWLALLALLVLGATLVAFLSPAPGRDLDPRSASKGGSKALARVLAGYDIRVLRTTSIGIAGADPTATVLVVDPAAYSGDQLLELVRGAGRVVLIDPGEAALDVLLPGTQRADSVTGMVRPDCSAAGARAAGPVDLGDASGDTYAGPGLQSCYEGLLVSRGQVDVLGSAELLRNDALARRGVAALDVNVVSADRSVSRVTWLLPGADAAGPGAPTVWDLFPSGAHRAFTWLLLVGVVLVLWQGRRLGPPVREPLPVVVRAAEVVEGHGRLYQRARARDRAAAALRGGTSARLARQLGLPPDADATRIAGLLGRPGAAEVLAGAAPADDARLLELAAALRQLEAVAGVPPEGKDER